MVAWILYTVDNDEIRIIHLKYALFITLETVITLKEKF